MAAPRIIERPEVTDGSTSGSELWVVTVFNNDYNTYEEVIDVLMIATACAFVEAHMEAWEIDNLGRSVVHQGKQDDCRCISEVISKIGIKVEVSQE